MRNDAKLKEEMALGGVKSYMFVSDGNGGVKLVERDTFYDMAGEALEEVPQKPAGWYRRDARACNTGVLVERETIDDLTEDEKIAVENPVITKLRKVADTVTGQYQKPVMVPAYRR
jgi:hypothetical protein